MEKTINPEEHLDRADSKTEDISDLAWGFLNTIAAQCYKTAKTKGWWQRYEGTIATGFMHEIVSSKLMLVVSELAEALEEVRADPSLTRIYFTGVVDGVVCDSDEPTEISKKPEGFPIELADAIIRIFDLAMRFHIDLAYAVRIKMAYNEGRAFKHGGKAI